MRQVSFGLGDMHLHGSAFYDFLALRKRYFVDTLAWDIPHDSQVEMDQYDNPVARYSVVLRDGEVLGGARIMPFDARWGPHSSMLRDASLGLIQNIPASLFDGMGRDWADAHECTRLTLSHRLAGSAERRKCLALVVRGLVEIALEGGARELVTLTVPPLRRSLRGLGYDARQIGPAYANAQDGRIYAILHMPARHAGEGRMDVTAMPLG